MKLRRTALLASLFLLILAMASQSYADISNAAVLFLRIAPGARAASMGEAFVAIADDATATHYNPAGLGASPLSKNWIEAKIPAEYRPLKGLAAMKARGGSTYASYDVWAVTAKGLLRYDNRKWRSGDVFETATDDNMFKIVGRYYGVTDKDALDTLVLKVAVMNSADKFESITAFRDTVLAAAPKDYKNLKALQVGLDSLVQLYPQCRINWENVKEARSRFAEARKDGAVSDAEMDRVSFAIERTRNRFIAEQIIMPYSARMNGDLTGIVSTGDAVLVGTTDGLFSYNGRVWRRYDSQGNLPSDSVLTMSAISNSAFIGTDKGIARFNGTAVVANADTANAPKGRVQAIGGATSSNVWAVIDGDLYHFDGVSWSNRQRYMTTIEDSPEKIAAKYAIYGTPAEQQLFLKKLRGGSDSGAYPSTAPGTVVSVPYLGEIKGRVNAIGVGAGKSVWLGTEYGIIYLDKDKWVMPGYRQATVDSAKTLTAYVAKNEFWVESQRDALVKALRCLNDLPGDAIPAGTKLRMPAADDASHWVILEYRTTTLDSNRTVDAIVKRVKDLDPAQSATYSQVFRTLNGLTGDTVQAGTKLRVPSAEEIEKWNLAEVKVVSVDSATTVQAFTSRMQDAAYAQWLRKLNDLVGDTIAAGSKLLVSRRPVPEVFGISPYENSMMFATSDGLVEYDGVEFRRSDFRGVSSAPAREMSQVKDQLWVAGDDRIVTSSRGRAEMSLMYVKWLPDLAPDLYYSFLSFVKPTNSWGTIGGNVTYISYGKFSRTGENNSDVISEFQSFDVAVQLAYGNSISNRLKGGVGLKVIYSKLSDQGAGTEVGKGTSTGFALDFGLLYQWTPRLNLGVALTNLGPKMAYIDANQADDLPRNLGVGLAYKVLQGTYTRLVVTAEGNKLMVGLNQGVKEELKQTVINAGAEFSYANLISARTGYIYDQEGRIKVATVGVGLNPIDNLKFDVSWVPNGQNVALNNTLRYSLSFVF